MMLQTVKQIIKIHILPNISGGKCNYKNENWSVKKTWHKKYFFL